MAEFCFKNAYVMINAVEHSDHVKSVTINYSAEMLDNTVMGDTARSRLAGLYDGSMSVEFIQDEADESIGEKMFDLLGAAEFAVKVRPVNTTISTSNPEYQFNAVMESIVPIGGTVGDLASLQCNFQMCSAITRDVTP